MEYSVHFMHWIYKVTPLMVQNVFFLSGTAAMLGEGDIHLIKKCWSVYILFIYLFYYLSIHIEWIMFKRKILFKRKIVLFFFF